MEFEIARPQHMKDPHAPRAVTVMFKAPPLDLHAEAWRILRAVVRGKELLPEHVQQYMEESLGRHSRFLAPGSAGASARKQFQAPPPGSPSAGLLSLDYGCRMSKMRKAGEVAAEVAQEGAYPDRMRRAAAVQVEARVQAPPGCCGTGPAG